MTETMKAYVLKSYGGAEASRLREVERPAPGPGEVLVKVMAAGLNPVDFKTREGMLKPILRFRLPAIMGNELAGVVHQVGEGVSAFSVGDRVNARTGKAVMGAFAEYACVRAEHLAKVPDKMDMVDAAAMPLAGLTALQALRDELALKAGQRVFIPGGAGGVGTYAIRIAKWLGAQVVTTASERGRDLVERMGADHIVDYTSQDLGKSVGEVDHSFDLVGGDSLKAAFAVTRRGGTVVSVTALPEPQTARKDLGRGHGLATLFWFASLPLRLRARFNGVRYRFLFMHPSGSELAELNGLAAQGLLEPVVDRVFPFEEIVEAMAYLERGHAKGKVVVRMDA